MRFFRFEDEVKPHTRRPANTTLDIISLFFFSKASSSAVCVVTGTGVSLDNPETLLVSAAVPVFSRLRLAILGLLDFGLVSRGTEPLLCSDFSRGREGREGLFDAAAAATEAPKWRFRFLRWSSAAEKVESIAVLRFCRKEGPSQGWGMKRPVGVDVSVALRIGELGGVTSTSFESSRSEESGRA